MLILDLWGISFHALVVFGLGKNILFKSILGHCVRADEPNKSQNTDHRESKKQYSLLSSSPLLSFLFQGAHKSSRCNSKVDAVGEDLLVPRQAHTSIFRQLIMGPDFIQNHQLSRIYNLLHHTPIPRITPLFIPRKKLRYAKFISESEGSQNNEKLS